MGFSALLLGVVLWQRGTELLKGGAGIVWQLGNLSVIKNFSLLFFLAYFFCTKP